MDLELQHKTKPYNVHKARAQTHTLGITITGCLAQDSDRAKEVCSFLRSNFLPGPVVHTASHTYHSQYKTSKATKRHLYDFAPRVLLHNNHANIEKKTHTIHLVLQKPIRKALDDDGDMGRPNKGGAIRPTASEHGKRLA